jgi:hypothetical protein
MGVVAVRVTAVPMSTVAAVAEHEFRHRLDPNGVDLQVPLLLGGGGSRQTPWAGRVVRRRGAAISSHDTLPGGACRLATSGAEMGSGHWLPWAQPGGGSPPERKSHNYVRVRSLLRGFHWLHAGVGPTMRADMLPTSDFYVVHGSHQVKACEAQNLPRPRRGRLPGPLACLTAAARDCCESQTSFSTPPLSPVAFQKCKHQ